MTAAAEPAAAQVRTARFIRLPNFLPPAEHAQLVRLVTRADHPGPFAPARVGHPDAAKGLEDPTIRKAKSTSHLAEAWPPLAQRIEELLPLLLPEEAGRGSAWEMVERIERTMLRYDQGDFYGLHVDAAGAVFRRLVTFVYYFNIGPKGFEGGELWLHDSLETDDGATAAETHEVIEPEDNSIVFFPSDLFHQVRPVRSLAEGVAGARFAINGWIHATELEAPA